MLNLDIYKKLKTYCDTAVKIHDKANKNGDWVDAKEQSEFEKMHMKIMDMTGTLPATETKDLPHPAGVESIRALKDALFNAIYEEEHAIVSEIIYADPNNGMLHPASSHSTGPIKNRTFAGMFGTPSKSNFKNFADYAGVIRSGYHDPRIMNLREGTGSAGGFVVPDELAAFMMDSSLENEVVRPRASIFAMKGETLKIPAFDGLNHSSSVLGGVTGNWLNESSEGSITDPSLRLMEMSAKKLAVFAKSSNELMEDSTQFGENLQQGLIRGMSWYLDLAFISGDGVGKPLGILNSPSLISVTKTIGQQSQTLTYGNLSDMFARLAPSCFANAIWIANPSTLGQLLKLVPPNTTSAYPVLNETNGTFRIFGKEVIFSEKVPALGSKGDIILCDLTQYAVALRKDIRIDKSADIRFMSDEAMFRAICRVDGQSLWNVELTPKNGPTCSWAVTVDTRA